MSVKDKIDKLKIPQHVAIIMDGNGRWAKSHGKIRLSGHQEGAKSVKKALEVCGELGIKYLTVYAFSTENWNRPKTEISGLMNLLVSSIDKELDEINKLEIKIKIIGEIDKLPGNVRKKLQFAIEKTKNNSKLTFIVALSYSGRWDILNAVKKIAQKVKDNKMNVSDIDYNYFESQLATTGIPDPELLIRTSGEERISNFLLYQLAYAELFFTDVLWPDFSKEVFYQAIIDYQNRERRFGKTSEQITN
ncbi:MAG: isoprenyl transferase [Bacteroidales bacterium]|nr:isoprenyl transferase [Bacteroidales bacterium]MDD4216459.1 isoprenyl transferase [Bacteroidales bacterium]MDY0141823.1 isoprenyl transferase [Bacteroidales bacterium]